MLCAHQGPGASPPKSSNVNRHALSALSMETAVDILSQLYRSGPALFCVARKTHLCNIDRQQGGLLQSMLWDATKHSNVSLNLTR